MCTEKLQFAERQFIPLFAAFACEFCQIWDKITGYNDEKRAAQMPPQQIYHTIYLWFLSIRDLSIITNFCVLQNENIDIEQTFRI